MRHKHILWPVFAAIFLAAVASALAPRLIDKARLWVEDDPVVIAERAVDARLSGAVAAREIEAALAADDIDLADSFVALAAERGIAIEPQLAARVEAAHSTAARAARSARHFARGLVIGEPNDAVELAGTALGDLFVFGDVRDATRESIHYVKGEAVDRPVLGLACVGLVITAGTYLSAGFATPVRVGVSLVKGAAKTGRLSVRMTAWLARALRDVVDIGGARRALVAGSFSERALRDVVKLDKAEGLIDTMRDVGRVRASAGTRAALDSLKVAEGPRDVSRFARLAAAKGGKTRAIIKLAGRAAIMLGLTALEVASWALSAVLMLFGFLSAIRSATERATLRYIDWRKARRWRRRWEALAAG